MGAPERRILVLSYHSTHISVELKFICSTCDFLKIGNKSLID
jgi:hypothetical protein